MKLYSYFRSSASYRVRIALNVKKLPYDYVPVHLVRDGGEQLKPEYRKVNVDGIVPTLVDGNIWRRRIPSRPCCPKRRATARTFAHSRCRSRARFIR
jgi:glutathione S-transferase